MCALDICVQLERLGLSPQIGLSSGYAFCGVIGRPFRKSYHVHGDCAVMCQALSWEAETRKDMILIDEATYSKVNDVLLMEQVCFTSSLFGKDIQIKGFRFAVKDKKIHHRRMSHGGGITVRETLFSEEIMDTQMTRYWNMKAFLPKSIPSRGHMKATKQIIGALNGASTLRDPHVVILSGQIGSGKKAALRHAVSCVDMKVTATFAPAFQREKNYSAMANVILKYMKNIGIDKESEIQNKMIQMLGGSKAPLTELLCVTNKLFYLKFPETKAAKAIAHYEDEDDRAQMYDCAKRCIVLEMLSKIAEDKDGGGCVMIITDGLNMDEGSWKIVRFFVFNPYVNKLISLSDSIISTLF